VGRLDSEKPAAIRLSGDNILEEHCHFDHTDGRVTIQSLPDSITFLNGKQLVPGTVITMSFVLTIQKKSGRKGIESPRNRT
ncbi:hypothetical protein H0H93_002147, partial [Arthromyces matolae]